MSNKPELENDLMVYYQMFGVLHSSRGHGMAGPMPLQVSEVGAYFNLIGEEDDEERLRGLMYIQRMDQVFLQYAAKQAQSRKK